MADVIMVRQSIKSVWRLRTVLGLLLEDSPLVLYLGKGESSNNGCVGEVL